MGASQASISFSTYDSMMEAFEMNLTTWSVYFDELRPSIDSDGPQLIGMLGLRLLIFHFLVGLLQQSQRF